MDFLSNWIQGIIISVVIVTIIEMILPSKSNNRKYIKMVLGIFIMFNIISPIINKFTNYRFNVDETLDIEKYIEEKQSYKVDIEDVNNNYISNIKEVYALNIKKDMKAKIEDRGYIVDIIDVEIGSNKSNEYIIKKVDLTLRVNINNNNDNDNNDNNEDYEDYEDNNYDGSINKVNINIDRISINSDNNKDSKEVKEDIEDIEDIDNRLTKKDIEELKDYLNSVYEIDKKYIYID